MTTNRRVFLKQAALLPPATLLGAREAVIGFGFGTYGMQSLKTDEALRVTAEIGYDGIEFALMPGWPTEPKLLAPAGRRQIRRQLEDLRLAVPALLESLPMLRSQEHDSGNVEKIKQACQLAHDLSPGRPPVVQTILGGKTSQWEETKQRMADELRKWAKAGEQMKTVVCFKPHAAHAVHDVKRAFWLHDQVGSKWLKVVFDYSHFYLENFSLADSLTPLLPITPYVQVKDSRGTPEKHDYLLPGDGKTDYVELLTILKKNNYSGFVNVEVSAQIHRKPGYEPIPTAKLCYQRLAGLFEKVGIRRPARKS